jgi:hypothetical protein
MAITVDVLFFVVRSSVKYDHKKNKYGDIIQTDFEENVDDDKTYYWFKFADKLHHQKRYDAIMKGVSPFYIGRMNTFEGYCGRHSQCPGPPAGCLSFSDTCWACMSGGIYGISGDALGKVIESEYTKNHISVFEDQCLSLTPWFYKLLFLFFENKYSNH